MCSRLWHQAQLNTHGRVIFGRAQSHLCPVPHDRPVTRRMYQRPLKGPEKGKISSTSTDHLDVYREGCDAVFLWPFYPVKGWEQTASGYTEGTMKAKAGGDPVASTLYLLTKATTEFRHQLWLMASQASRDRRQGYWDTPSTVFGNMSLRCNPALLYPSTATFPGDPL